MRLFLSLAAAGALLSSASLAHADGVPRHVTIEYRNVTSGIVLSTSAFVAHRHGAHLWVEGKAAELPLRELAEEGNPEYILGTAVLDGGHVFGDAAVAPPLLPGQSRRVDIVVTPEHPEVSGAVMLGQTNDGFAGVDAVGAYDLDHAVTIDALALDAGTSRNIEDKAHLRALGGFGRVAETGVVRPHPGLDAHAQVPAAWRFDPKQPILRVTITPAVTPNG